MQAPAYALAQLCSGGFSESHDQNLARAQARVVSPPVTENKPQVQSRQRPGLAGTGAGFYDLSPGQGQSQRV
jgi:hypothetical protein